MSTFIQYTPSASNIHRCTLGRVFGDRHLQNFGPKAKNRRRCFFWRLCVCVCLSVCQAVTMQGATASDGQPWCLHIFAAVATNISNTSQQSKINHNWWINSGVSLPLVGARTIMPQVKHIYGLLWHSWRCHSLEGVAWSRPGYPQWRWCCVGHPLHFAWESHL